MGSSLHITREPEEGWSAWAATNAPPDLRAQLERARESEDYDTLFDLEEKLESVLFPRKQALGLLITETDWIAAVEATPGVRIANRNPSWTNPRTGDVVSMLHSEHSVEVQKETGEWHLDIHFTSSGRILFSPAAWEAGNPVAIAACKLASKLQARIVGEEGDCYPLIPGADPVYDL